jgi:hypothetical protein
LSNFSYSLYKLIAFSKLQKMHDITTIHSSGADKPDYLNTGLGLSVSLDNVPSQGYLSDPVEEWEIVRLLNKLFSLTRKGKYL